MNVAAKQLRIVLVAALLAGRIALASPGETIAVTKGLAGLGPLGASGIVGMTSDAKQVFLVSGSPELLADDRNGFGLDVFRVDVATGNVEIVSRTASGEQVEMLAESDISLDGRFLVFASSSASVVSGDTNGTPDIFLRDLVAKTTNRISVTASGTQLSGVCRNPSISADGRYVLYESNTSEFGDNPLAIFGIYVYDALIKTTRRVDSTAANVFADRECSAAEISRSGTRCVFTSNATNLWPNDINMLMDVFVKDLDTGQLFLVDQSSTGGQASSLSLNNMPSISGDGTRVCFASTASNLVENDTNDNLDVFLRDLTAGTTRRISKTPRTSQPNGQCRVPRISGDGKTVVFQSIATNLPGGNPAAQQQLYLWKERDDELRLMPPTLDSSAILGQSYPGVIDQTGTLVSFTSDARKIVPGDANRSVDAFTLDTGTMQAKRWVKDILPTMANGDCQITAGDAQGSVWFESHATNLTEFRDSDTFPALFRAMDGNPIQRVLPVNSVDSRAQHIWTLGDCADADVLWLSTFLSLLPEDTNQDEDAYALHPSNGAIELISISQSGSIGDRASSVSDASADGRWYALSSYATNFGSGLGQTGSRAFRKDMLTGGIAFAGETQSGVQANSSSWSIGVSDDGRYLVFGSESTNLVPNLSTFNRRQMYRKDFATGRLTLASCSADGKPSASDVLESKLSANGRFLALATRGINMTNGINTGRVQVILKDLLTGEVTAASLGFAGEFANQDCSINAISATGRFVLFASKATNLDLAATAGIQQIYIRDMLIGQTWLVSKSTSGIPAVGDCRYAAMDDQARFVTFSSASANLVPLPALFADVFRHEISSTPTLQGSLAFEGWNSASEAADARYVLETSDGSTVASGKLYLDAESAYQIGKPAAGAYRLRLSGRSWLRRKISFQLPGNGDVLPPAFLFAGDCNSDNRIDDQDVDILLVSFDCSQAESGFDIRADLDGDGAVSLFDYLLLSQNYGLVGD